MKNISWVNKVIIICGIIIGICLVCIQFFSDKS